MHRKQTPCAERTLCSLVHAVLGGAGISKLSSTWMRSLLYRHVFHPISSICFLQQATLGGAGVQTSKTTLLRHGGGLTQLLQHSVFGGARISIPNQRELD
jgi:hypothetical protein